MENPEPTEVSALDYVPLAKEVKAICANREYTIRLKSAIIAVLHAHGLPQTREHFLAIKTAFLKLPC